MNVITLKPHRYKNKQKVKGDKYEFNGTKQELRLALALWVKPYVALVPKPAAWPAPPEPVFNEVIETVIDPVIAVEEDEVIESEEKFPEHNELGTIVAIVAEEETIIPKQKRTYKRRDMVSDE